MSNIKGNLLRRDLVRDEICRLIRESSLHSGDRLLSEKKMGEQLGVNHLTVRAALAELAEAGVVRRQAGVGTFFTGKLVECGGADEYSGTIPGMTALFFRNDAHFYGDFLNQIVLALQESGSRAGVTICDLTDFGRNLASLEQVRSWRAETLIALQPSIEVCDEMCESFNRIAAEHRHVVRLLGNGCSHIPLSGSQITVDYGGAYGDVIRRLKALGHRRIAYFGGRCDKDFLYWRANRRYIDLYVQGMLESDLGDYIMTRCVSSQSDIPLMAEEILDSGATACLCLTDNRGAMLMDAARRRGLRIPDDLAVVGSTDTPWSVGYRMDSLRLPCESLVSQLMSCLRDDCEVGDYCFPLSYVKRETTELV